MNVLTFKFAATAIFLTAGFGAGYAYYVGVPFAGRQAVSIALKAEETGMQGKDLIIQYRYAHLLSPSNEEISLKLAEAYKKNGQYKEAANIYLKLPAGEGTVKGVNLLLTNYEAERAEAILEEAMRESLKPQLLPSKSKVMLERNRAADAVLAAKESMSYGLRDEAALLHLTLIYSAIGETAKSEATAKLLTSSEARKEAESWKMSKTALAQELYVRGLPMSSERVLERGSGPEDAKGAALLLRIKGDRSGSPEELFEIQKKYAPYIKKYPASIELRLQLISLSSKLGDTKSADEQREIIKKLRTGEL